MRLLKLPGLPGKDAADALGLAITHAHAGASLAAMAMAAKELNTAEVAFAAIEEVSCALGHGMEGEGGCGTGGCRAGSPALTPRRRRLLAVVPLAASNARWRRCTSRRAPSQCTLTVPPCPHRRLAGGQAALCGQGEAAAHGGGAQR